MRTETTFVNIIPLVKTVKFLAGAAACLLGFCYASGAVFATPPNGSALPALGPVQPLALPKVFDTRLSNGLRVVVLEDHRQPALWMRLAFRAGSVRDPQGKVGLAAMVADLLTRGTSTESEEQIASRVDSLGATLGAGADNDYLTVSAYGLSSEAGDLFDLLADVTQRPTFSADQVERYKLRTASAIKADLGDPKSLASAAIARLVYGAFPYGNYASGTPETLAGLTSADAVGFYQSYFAPKGATLFLAGDITPAAALVLAEKRFGGWKGHVAPDPPAPPAIPVAQAPGIKPQITLIDRQGSEQTEIRIGTIIPGYSDPNRFEGTVASAILGYGSFGTRLVREIRIKRGLSYGASAYYARSKEAGAFLIETFTKNASTGQVLKIALDVTQDMRINPPGAQELADRKAFLDGSFAVSVATPGTLLERLSTAYLYGNGPSDLTLYTHRVNAVTAQQVTSILAALPLDSDAQVVLVGDAKAIQAQLAGLGTLRVIEMADLDLLSPTLLRAAAGAGSAAPASAP